MGSVIYTRVAWVTASKWITGAQGLHGVINLHLFIPRRYCFNLFIPSCRFTVYTMVTLVTPMPTGW